MGIFDSFKKKNAPLPELEMPPSPEMHSQEQKPFEPMPGEFEHPPEMPADMPREMPSFEDVPSPPEEMRAPPEPLQVPPQAPSMLQQISIPDHPEHHEPISFFQPQLPEQIPMDVTQELLSLPKKEPTLQQGPVKVHISRQYMTVSTVMDIQEQITNLNDDIALGKDTAYRLSDLHEQEIEKMAKWHALHEAMELRMAQIDKILFKA